MKQDRLSIKLKRFKLNEADESNDEEQRSDDNEKTEDKGLLCYICSLNILTENTLQYNNWTIRQPF